MNLPPLRPYQSNVLERGAVEVRKGASSVLFCMPTGTGKTRTAVEACIRHVRLGGTPMFVAPRRELISQASDALASGGLHPGHDVFVRTIQELVTTDAEIPPASMVVLDEARHYVADAWSKLRTKIPDAVYLGLDATPERGDGRGLGGMFDVLLEAISIRDAIAGGYLVPCDYVRPDRSLGVDLAQDPVDAWWAHAKGAMTVVFVRSVEDARRVAGEFCARGVVARAVWGEMPTTERDNALALFARGEVGILVNVQLLTEGWDSPVTECVILACGASTVGGYLQRVGRGLRPYPKKSRCLLIDLCGVSHDLGDPDEPRTWHLDGKAARRMTEDADVRFCPVCGAPTVTAACEQCGYSGELRRRKPRVLGLPLDRFARQRAEPDEEKIKKLAFYMHMARQRRYSPWWAIKKWEAVYGGRVTNSMKLAAMRLGG